MQRGDNIKFLVTCSYLEIYNETIFDLLDAGSSGLAIREDVKRGVFVRDLQELTVENADEASEVRHPLLATSNLHTCTLAHCRRRGWAFVGGTR